MRGARFGLSFKLAQFGAYSGALSVEIEDYSSQGFLVETPTKIGSNPTVQYRKSDLYDEKMSGLTLPAPAWTDLARQLIGKQTRELEAISTVVYLLKTGTTKVDLEERFCKLKPHLKPGFDSARDEALSLMAG